LQSVEIVPFEIRDRDASRFYASALDLYFFRKNGRSFLLGSYRFYWIPRILSLPYTLTSCTFKGGVSGELWPEDCVMEEVDRSELCFAGDANELSFRG
jgi:hypothetical protein